MVDVIIGEVIGDTNYFVKQRDEWEALGIPPRHLQPIVTRMRQLAGLRVTKKEVSALYGAIPLLLSLRGRRIPKSIQRYLDSYPLKYRLVNKTFAKRKPWYQVSYASKALAFIGSLSHESPKIVLNSAGISCANGLYKLTPKRGVVWDSWIAAASLTTVFRLSAELQARIRGAGALKLEPSDVAKLLIPANMASPDAAATRALLVRLDSLMRRGEYESATREADDALLLGTGALAYSGRAPDATTALRIFSMWATMKILNSAGVPPAGSAPRSEIRIWNSGVLNARASSALILAMIAPGVLAGATSPYQPMNS
jgi:hypothetical protein